MVDESTAVVVVMMERADESTMELLTRPIDGDGGASSRLAHLSVWVPMAIWWRWLTCIVTEGPMLDGDG